MSDELDHLRNTPAPPPRLAAKKRAIAAGLAAFNEAKAGEVSPQGNSAKPRLTLASNQNARSRFMRAKTYYALAASVAVAALGAPMAIEMWKNADGVRFGKVSSQLNAPADAPVATAKETRRSDAPAGVAAGKLKAAPQPQASAETPLANVVASPNPPSAASFSR